MRLTLTFVAVSLCSCSAFLLDRPKPTTTKKPSGGINVINIAITQKPTDKPTDKVTQTTPIAVTVSRPATTEAAVEESTTTNPVTKPSTDAVTTEASTDGVKQPTTQIFPETTIVPDTPAPVTDKARPPASCGGCKDSGNLFALVESSDCRLFKLEEDSSGKPLACPARTRFDVNLCACNHEDLVACQC